MNLRVNVLLALVLSFISLVCKVALAGTTPSKPCPDTSCVLNTGYNLKDSTTYISGKDAWWQVVEVPADPKAKVPAEYLNNGLPAHPYVVSAYDDWQTYGLTEWISAYPTNNPKTINKKQAFVFKRFFHTCNTRKIRIIMNVRADDSASIWFDGKYICSSAGTWKTGKHFDMTFKTKTDSHSLTVRLTNKGGATGFDLQGIALWKPAPDRPVETAAAAPIKYTKTDTTHRASTHAPTIAAKPVQTPKKQIDKLIQKQYDLNLNTCLVTAVMYDDEDEDGDIVSVYFNETEIVTHQTLKLRKHGMIVKVLQLEPGKDNELVTKAWNTGTEGQNTLKIQVYEGDISDDAARLETAKPLLEKKLSSTPGVAASMVMRCSR